MNRMLLRQLLYLLALTPHLFYCSNYFDNCYDNIKIHYNDSSNNNESDIYTMFNESSNCVKQIPTSLKEPLEICPPGLLTVQLGAIALFPQHKLPSVALNISVLVFEPVDWLFVRFQCLDAPSGDDKYCHSDSAMVVDGVWLWPCRGLRFHEPDEVQLPFQFGYECFRLYSRSQYLVNVTVAPHNCISSHVITSPGDSLLFPSIAQFYRLNGKDPSARGDSDWAPLLVVDLTDATGVWLKVEHSPLGRLIRIAVYEESATGSLHFLEEFDVVAPDSGVKWKNVAEGEYVLLAYVPRHDCQLICNDEERCALCPHTRLNFTMPQHRFSTPWRALRVVRDAAVVFFSSVIVCIVLSSLAAGAYLWWLRRRSRRQRPEDVELVTRPSVLLVYSDDCEQHSDVVKHLARYLSRHANANVMLDQFEINSTGWRPSRWLVDSMCSAAKVLIIPSPCTTLLLSGQRLSQRRPFADLFVPAMDLVFNECTTSSRNGTKSRFIIVHLPYVETIPRELEVLGLPVVRVPTSLPVLTAHIHDVDQSQARSVEQPTNQSDLTPLQLAIGRMQRLIREEPLWMEDRLAQEEETENAEVVEAPMQKREAKDPKQVADELGILPPDETPLISNDEEANEEDDFQLLPPD